MMLTKMEKRNIGKNGLDGITFEAKISAKIPQEALPRSPFPGVCVLWPPIIFLMCLMCDRSLYFMLLVVVLNL